jgi:hypothetical protein
MRILALLATYNEERFIAACLEHLIRQGCDVYLIDNESTDRTVSLARGFLGCGLVEIESLARNGVYHWERILGRKQSIAGSADYAWFMHVDADEIRLPPSGFETLADAVQAADRSGYNAINFSEFAFVPTQEAPDHDHPEFLATMQWYYPFRPRSLNRVNLWRRPASGQADLTTSGGHHVHFPDQRILPTYFPMRHYLFLSMDHARRKWLERRYHPDEVKRGWHRARARLSPPDLRLLPQEALHRLTPAGYLDASRPRERHPVFMGYPSARHADTPPLGATGHLEAK